VEEGSERVAPTICLTRLLWMSMQARNLVIFGGGGGGVFFVWLFGLVVVGLVGWWGVLYRTGLLSRKKVVGFLVCVLWGIEGCSMVEGERKGKVQFHNFVKVLDGQVEVRSVRSKYDTVDLEGIIYHYSQTIISYCMIQCHIILQARKEMHEKAKKGRKKEKKKKARNAI